MAERELANGYGFAVGTRLSIEGRDWWLLAYRCRGRGEVEVMITDVDLETKEPDWRLARERSRVLWNSDPARPKKWIKVTDHVLYSRR